jgi:hypothetical protein
MQFKVVFTDTADDTFDSIGNQILARWGEPELFKFRARVYEVVEKISISPLIFQEIKNSTNIRKAVIHKNCSLLYTIKDTTIEILFFWDNRQEPML